MFGLIELTDFKAVISFANSTEFESVIFVEATEFESVIALSKFTELESDIGFILPAEFESAIVGSVLKLLSVFDRVFPVLYLLRLKGLERNLLSL